jgi:Na+/melibiose symporter-like transporter
MPRGIYKMHHPTKPLGIILIAGFYVFGAIVLLVSMFTMPEMVSRQIAERQGLPMNMGISVLLLTAIVALFIAYGLFSLSSWGFYLTLIYLIYFGGISFFLGGNTGIQPYLGNLLWSILVIMYLLFKRKSFFGMKTQRFSRKLS